jgi:ribosome-binding ATPase
MNIKAGLVGLPNVGKSTLFNALTNSSAPAQNYPFCTIEPHIAITQVPDQRLEQLKRIYSSNTIVPATATFVDIAGLVKGAASGEGLGNKFLSNIYSVHLIVHVIRCFEGGVVVRDSEVDPLGDYEIITTELILKDLESIQKRLEKLEKLKKQAQGPEKQAYEHEHDALINIRDALNSGDTNAARHVAQSAPMTIPLLTTKNFLIVANVAEASLENNEYERSPQYRALIETFGTERVIPIAIKTEHELSQIDPEEAAELMLLLGMKERSLMTIIQKTYQNLDLITFFTCGPQEVHAWPITKGSSIKKAAGEIHSDLEKGFICAEVFNFNDLASLKTVTAVKQQGKVRIEGASYIVGDGDIVNVRFNV